MKMTTTLCRKMYKLSLLLRQITVYFTANVDVSSVPLSNPHEGPNQAAEAVVKNPC